MISLFTPTHNPKYLGRLAHSVNEQSYEDFEWVIVPNGPVTPEEVASILASCGDIEKIVPKIRIIPYSGKTTNIGEIKNFCCYVCKGDALAELDHDDEITPDCLQEVADAMFDPKVDFTYSNCCEIHEGKPFTYSEIFGWKYRPFTWKGLPLLECISFDPSPASFSKIWYAPNHIRVWRKEFYNKIGGHDHSLDVLDDQDLMARTYIHGNVKKIDKCLYVYYYTGENTCKGEKNAKIQDLCLALHDKHIYQITERWCKDNKLRMIDLCGGIDKPPGYESIDKFNGDITYDLDHPDWPIESGTVGIVRAHDALEHLRDPINTLKEIHRILAPNGWLLSLTPSTEGRGAWCDPTHKSYWNSVSFWYYTKAQQARYIGTPVKFQLNRIRDFFPSEFHEFHRIPYVAAHLLKYNGRTPGLIEI